MGRVVQGWIVERLAHVRFGSLAAAATRPSRRRGCFTPKSCRGCRRPSCPLWANSGCSETTNFRKAQHRFPRHGIGAGLGLWGP